MALFTFLKNMVIEGNVYIFFVKYWCMVNEYSSCCCSYCSQTEIRSVKKHDFRLESHGSFYSSNAK